MVDGEPLTYCRSCHVGEHVRCLGNLVLTTRMWCECPSPRCIIDRLPHKWMRERLEQVNRVEAAPWDDVEVALENVKLAIKRLRSM